MKSWRVRVQAGYARPYSNDVSSLLMAVHALIYAKKITRSGVLQRGWTEGMIDQYLGKADQLTENRHVYAKAPIQLFCLTRVEIAEEIPEVKYWIKRVLEKRQRKETAPKEQALSKREQLIQWIDSLDIDVPLASLWIMVKIAVKDNNQRLRSLDPSAAKFLGMKPLTLESHADDLEKALIKYAFIQCEGYFKKLEERAGTTHVPEDLKERLRRKISDAIRDYYGKIYTDINSGIVFNQRRWKEDRLKIYGGNPGKVYRDLQSDLGELIAQSYANDWAGKNGYRQNLIQFVQKANEMFEVAGIPNFIQTPRSELTIDVVTNAFIGLHPIDGVDYPEDEEDLEYEESEEGYFTDEDYSEDPDEDDLEGEDN